MIGTNTGIDFGESQQALNGLLDKWKSDRMGKFTSSNMSKLLVKGKTSFFGQGALTYIYAKIAETITGEANELSGKAIEWGEQYEEDAARMFEKMSGFEVEIFGKTNPVFYPYKLQPEHAGGSPDGIVRDPSVGGFNVLEIKCPYESKYHAEVLHKVKTGSFNLKDYDGDYYGQVQANIFFTEASGAYFVSYDPRCVDYRYSCVWAFVERDEDYIANMLTRLNEAIKAKLETLNEIGFYESL